MSAPGYACMRAGMDDFLAKPLTLSTLAAALRRHVVGVRSAVR